MPKKKKILPHIIKDTREQKGWEFSPSKNFAGTEVKTLPTGDYSIEGYEHLFVIERKGSVVELAQNLTNPDKWDAFARELERLQEFPLSFIFCEFNIDDVVLYPRTTNLPWPIRRKIKVRPEYYLKRVMELMTIFNGRVFFTGPNFGQETALSLCKRIVEKWPNPADVKLD